MNKQGTFSVQRNTKTLKDTQIPYFVNREFGKKYDTDVKGLHRVEKQVYEEYADMIGQNCIHEIESKQRKVTAAKRGWDKKKVETAQAIPLPSCDRFKEVYGNDSRYNFFSRQIDSAHRKFY